LIKKIINSFVKIFKTIFVETSHFFRHWQSDDGQPSTSESR